MNELLQKHGCANVFSIPEGLKELMSDISREVLRDQPPELYKFIANYLSCLLITREHGVMAVKILDDLCDCRPNITEHLAQLGLDTELVELLTPIIQEAIEGKEAQHGTESVREAEIIKEVLKRGNLDELTGSKVCQVIRNAYRDYWYRRNLLKKGLKITPDEPWEVAAQHTLELYKKTKPSFSELTRAAERIQAAYRGYHVRSCLLQHLRIQRKYKPGPKVKLPGPPIDIADSREVHLGPVTDIHVKKDDVRKLFDEHTTRKLGIKYDPMMTITHVPDEVEDIAIPRRENRQISFSEPLGHDTRGGDRPPSDSLMLFPPGAQDAEKPKDEEKMEEVQEVIAPPPAEEPIPEVPEDISERTVSFHEDMMESYEIPEELSDARTEGDGMSLHTSSEAEDGTAAAAVDVDDVEEPPL